jgi:hypothetical protein
MNLYEERPIGRLSPSELLRRLKASRKRDKRVKDEEEKDKEPKWYQEYQNRVQDYKEKRFKWQQELAAKNAAERLKQEKAEKLKAALDIKPEAHSARDPESTAARKSFSNVGRLIGGIARAGVSLGMDALEDRAQRKTDSALSQKALPPASEGPSASKEPSSPEPGNGPNSKSFLKIRRKPKVNRIAKPAITNVNVQGLTPPQRLLPPARPAITDPSRLLPSSTRLDKKRNQENARRASQGISPLPEEIMYSCWREEFLNELGDLRRKSKENKNNLDDKPIEPMTGVNKITLNPTTSEAFTSYSKLLEDLNGASIFAKATPPLKKRTTPMSDIYLSKQPGKGSAENVEKTMRKLFLGNRNDFYSNYDLSGHKSDDNDIQGKNSAVGSPTNEAYDEGHLETFRQHSKEGITSNSQDNKDAERKKRIRAALANLNRPPTKKKKKKKKKEEI